ncbi:hypothetical protein [Vibrio phage S4-7]|nr:hypothetical protein [Vibrio phage S4-7]
METCKLIYNKNSQLIIRIKVVLMQELMGLMKIMGSVIGGLGFLITFIAWFVKRTITEFEYKDKKLREDINTLQNKSFLLDKEVAVLQEGKIGRDELRQELTKVEETFGGQLKELKEDLKSDLSDIKALLRDRRKM